MRPKVSHTDLITIRDQLGRPLQFACPPERIVSLVPSLTELVCDLGLRDRLVGITKFCVHPEGLTLEKKVTGGTKNVHLNKVAALNPDIILASKEENVQEQVEALANRFPVYVSDVKDLPSAIHMIEDLAGVLGRQEAGHLLVKAIEAGYNQAQPAGKAPRVAYLIWKRPFMVAGGDSFISAMLEACGMINAFASEPRYPIAGIEDFRTRGCDAILLSSEPYPFKEADRLDLERLTQLPCRLVDGEAFSWYGSRIPKGLRYGSGVAKEIRLAP